MCHYLPLTNRCLRPKKPPLNSMFITDELGDILFVPDNSRLQQAIKAGAVYIDSINKMSATIIAPPAFEYFTDEEILLLLQFASECGKMLEDVGFNVSY